MVLCLQNKLRDDCPKLDDEVSVEETSFKCPERKKPCNCTKIIGRDHLKTKRARKFTCKNKRIVCLAQPKFHTQKFCDEEADTSSSAVEVIRTFEEQTPVRIKLLAYPKVRKLVSSRDALKGIVDKQWYERLEKLIHRSMLTMYSRMANVQLPEKTMSNKKWTKADWQRHCEWLKKRALPKTSKPSPSMQRKRVPLDALMASIHALSRPRQPRPKFHPWCGYHSTVKNTTLMYEPSARILSLAAAKQLRVDPEDSEEFKPFQVNPNALKFEPTDRIKKLAVPKPKPLPENHSDVTQFGVAKRALKAKLKERTLELAKPKEKADDDDEEEKPLVNPRALKAKPTPRIIKLAEPRLPIAEKYKD